MIGFRHPTRFSSRLRRFSKGLDFPVTSSLEEADWGFLDGRVFKKKIFVCMFGVKKGRNLVMYALLFVV